MGNCVWFPEPKSSPRASRAARVIGAAVRVKVIRAQAVRADGATVVETRTQVIKMEAIESPRVEIFIARSFIGSKSSAERSVFRRSEHFAPTELFDCFGGGDYKYLAPNG